MKYFILAIALVITGFSNRMLAQCAADATFVPTYYQPLAGTQVNFLYWGGIAYQSDWTYSIDYGNGTSFTAGTYSTLVNNVLGYVTYSAPGIYVVTLTVTDPSPGSCPVASYSMNLEVSAAPCNMAAPAFTNAFKQYACAEETVSFAISYTGAVDHVEWDMGDGNTVITTGLSTSYEYSQPGVYFVEVKLFTNVPGCFRNACVTTPGQSGNMNVFYCLVYVGDGDPEITMSPANPTVGQTVTFTYTGDFYLFPPDYTNCWRYQVDLNTGTYSGWSTLNSGSTLGSIANVQAGILYTIILHLDGSCVSCDQYDTLTFYIPESVCDTCNSFKPKSGETYWLSAWVQEDNGGTQVSTYDDVSISLDFVGTSTTTVTLTPTGEIIDGWQRIAGEFTIPANTYDLEVNLNAGNLTTYFDDIRIHPFNGSMKSYVYDGTTFWLVAELDDNNYATFYEYDAEGGLIRIKKETSGGIVTIQETRSSTVKITP